MNLFEINAKVEGIEEKIFLNSIMNDLSIQELGSIYCSLIKLKNIFLNLGLKEHSKEDVDSIRFKIAENILNIKIIIKEWLKMNCEAEVIQMKELWNNFAG